MKTAYNLKVSEVIMMQENNLLNRNSTNDIQGVKSTYALVILISSIETENQLSCCGSTTEMNENSETGYIFGIKIPKSVEDEGILWTLSRR